MLHTEGALHAVPQVPQCAESASVLTQLAPQRVSPIMQFSTHEPPSQSSPAAHTLPQVPQCATSVWTSTQAPLQSVSPAPQPVDPPQLPSLQVSALPHAFPQPPQ